MEMQMAGQPRPRKRFKKCGKNSADSLVKCENFKDSKIKAPKGVSLKKKSPNKPIEIEEPLPQLHQNVRNIGDDSGDVKGALQQGKSYSNAQVARMAAQERANAKAKAKLKKPTKKRQDTEGNY